MLQPKALPEALSPEETEELKKCEAIIKKGWTTFLQVGRALMTIRDKRLYRDRYHTFEAYCREQRLYSRTHMDRWIKAAEVDAVLTPIGVKLDKESQLRELAGLKYEDIQAVGKKIKELGEEEITAKVIREAAAKYKPKTDWREKGRKKSKPKAIHVKLLLKLIDTAETAANKNDIKRVLEVLGKSGRASRAISTPEGSVDRSGSVPVVPALMTRPAPERRLSAECPTRGSRAGFIYCAHIGRR